MFSVTDITGILVAYGTFTLLIMSPGPNNMAVMAASMGRDRSAGLATAVGVTTGSLTWALLTVMGISAVIASSENMLSYIKLFGGIYLLWLGYRSFTTRVTTSEETPQTRNPAAAGSLAGCYFRGLLLQLSNPKAALTWITIISIGLHVNPSFWVSLVIVAGTTIIALLVHSFYAFMFSTRAALDIYRKYARWIQGCMGTIFVLAGIKLILD